MTVRFSGWPSSWISGGTKEQSHFYQSNFRHWLKKGGMMNWIHSHHLLSAWFFFLLSQPRWSPHTWNPRCDWQILCWSPGNPPLSQTGPADQSGFPGRSWTSAPLEEGNLEAKKQSLAWNASRWAEFSIFSIEILQGAGHAPHSFHLTLMYYYHSLLTPICHCTSWVRPLWRPSGPINLIKEDRGDLSLVTSIQSHWCGRSQGNSSGRIFIFM